MGDSSPTSELDADVVRNWLLEKASVEFVEQTLAEKVGRKPLNGDLGGRRRKNSVFEGDGNVSPGKFFSATKRNSSVSSEFSFNSRNGGSKRPSVTSELYHTWIATSPVKSPTSKSPVSCSGRYSSGDWKRHQIEQLDEGELFMELIKDVSNELDIDVLCHKILVNVGLLTKADRGSLFLTQGGATSEHRYLVAKLFDVTVHTELEEATRKAKSEEIRIPFGVGIAGSVAETKKIINITNAYEDARFNRDVDQRTGYKTNSILCVPICDYEGEVIGVAQIINKAGGANAFNDRDIQIFQRYLTFCGISIQNAQLFELSVQEFKRNQILLSLARNIFEEQNNLECLVTKIMTQAKNLLKCQRCGVFLLDLDCGEARHLRSIEERPKKQTRLVNVICKRKDSVVNLEEILSFQKEEIDFPTIFELRSDSEHYYMNENTSYKSKDCFLLQIAKYVAATGQIVNIDNVSSQLCGEGKNCMAKCVLCMPILNGQKNLIGVAQMIDKECGGVFTENDISMFEAFAIFCGLGIHNTQMYENACKLMAKQKVALECLSYHATASIEDTAKLVQDTIPSAETYNLYSFTFIDFNLTDEDTCKAAIRMFLECKLVQKFQIPYQVLCRWVLSVKKNYRPVKYHNWRHALNVAQTMFAMLKTGKMERFMTDLEILGLLVACLCHDLDHRGTNNAFQSKTESPLAVLYSTSTMEHHHFDQCVMILNSEGNNIFQALSPEEYRTVMKVVENSILSTDLAMYFKKRSRFLELLENGEFDWQSEERKELLCGILMTACDVSAIAKPWDVQHKIAKLVADEFFDQGDLEKLQLNEKPVAMMDREKKDELPQMQVNFIDTICLPLYKVLSETFPWIKPLYDGTLENRKHWEDLAEKVEMGLTWIDHDFIEKPVEEFSVDSKRKDFEFTVTTLNCSGSVNRKYPAKNGFSLNLHTTSAPSIDTMSQGSGSTSLHRLTRFTSFRRHKSCRVTPRTKVSNTSRSFCNRRELSKEELSISNTSECSKSTINTVQEQVPSVTSASERSDSISSNRSKTKQCVLM